MQLDISIKSADKYLTSENKIKKFLNEYVEVEQKTDGIKLTILKIENNGNINDYVFAYKGNILYQNEFNYQNVNDAKNNTVGASQFKLVFEHFKNIKNNSIPIGTELFIEFLMSKPTLSSNYTNKHKMILIGHSISDYDITFGKLKTKNNGFFINKREEYAKVLNLDTPNCLYSGKLSALKFGNDLTSLKQHFLNIPSVYGGIEEGVVLRFNDMLLKWQQDYQHDKDARFAIKMKYKEDDKELEDLYWQSVIEQALDIISEIDVKNQNLDDLLNELSIQLTHKELKIKHSKKSNANVKDDIQLTAKLQLIKRMEGNNNALIIGKFRVLTNAHLQLINSAKNNFDNVIVCIVTSKDTKETLDIRTKMIEEFVENENIINSSNANIIRLLSKSPININHIVVGTDRYDSYNKQVQNILGVDIIEMKRTDEDISASKIIQNMNYEYFQNNTPKEVHKYYNLLKEVYG